MTKTNGAVNLDNDDEMSVFDLHEIARKIPGCSYAHKLQKLIDDPEKSTPAPTLKLNGKPVWNQTGLLEWKALWDKETQAERELEEERLRSETLKKSSIIEHLLEEAKLLERLNSRSYTHNRGNSLSDGRRRILEFDGKYEFVRKLMGELRIPAEKDNEIQEHLRKAKHHVNVK